MVSFTGTTPATRDPYYGFNRFRQKPDFDWTTTPAIGGPSGYLEENREAAYTRFMADKLGVGLSDQSAWAQWVRDQFKNTEAGFLAAIAEDPTMTYLKYLPQLNIQNLRNQFLRQSPRARGLFDSRVAGPMRTIADV